MELADLLFNETIGKAAKTQHERDIDACIPEAVDIANLKIREAYLINSLPDAEKEALNWVNQTFFAAMNEVTSKEGLRIL